MVSYEPFGIAKNGYGKISLAHRVVYHMMGNDLAHDTKLDHICRTPLCVNPSHVREVTQKQNCEHRVPQRRSQTGIRGVFPDGKGGWEIGVGCTKNGRVRGIVSCIKQAEAITILCREIMYTHSDLDEPKRQWARDVLLPENGKFLDKARKLVGEA